jgi:hypothetical protein
MFSVVEDGGTLSCRENDVGFRPASFVNNINVYRDNNDNRG